MKFEEIDNLIGSTFNSELHDVERRDYREIEANDPIRFKGYGDKSGLMYLAEYNDNYVDANLYKKSIRLRYRDMDDNLIDVIFDLEQFTTQHLLMFIDLIKEHRMWSTKWESKIQKLKQNQLPTEYLRMGKLDELTDI